MMDEKTVRLICFFRMALGPPGPDEWRIPIGLHHEAMTFQALYQIFLRFTGEVGVMVFEGNDPGIL